MLINALPLLGLLGLLRLASALMGGFGTSCHDVTYWGYCRIMASCTDGDANTTSFLNIGQCLAYDNSTAQLHWREKSVPAYQSTLVPRPNTLHCILTRNAPPTNSSPT